MFTQYEDRPLCCNDITEFIGYPENEDELIDITKKNIYWEKQVKEKTGLLNFKKYGFPYLKDIATFKCKHCTKKYFTFQFI